MFKRLIEVCDGRSEWMAKQRRQKWTHQPSDLVYDPVRNNLAARDGPCDWSHPGAQKLFLFLEQAEVQLQSGRHSSHQIATEG
jgi:hypothetical protein